MTCGDGARIKSQDLMMWEFVCDRKLDCDVTIEFISPRMFAENNGFFKSVNYFFQI